jgi:hypothetical protein
MEAEGPSGKSGSLYQTTRHYSLKATVFTVTPVGASGLPREFLYYREVADIEGGT